MNYKSVLTAVSAVLLSVCLTGCFSANPEHLQYFTKPEAKDVTMDEYILQPPDQITVTSSKIPELKGTTQNVGLTQIIRPDGKVSFESVGEIMVAGKTPKQVAEIISDKMVKLYKLPGEYPVDVRVVNNSKYYYVVGEVRRPGAQIFSGRETTLSAIAKAVILVSAWEEKIQVIRPSLNPEVAPKIFQLNLKKMVEHGDMTANVLLQEGDVIYVPPTILASIGRTVGEITSPIFSGAGALNALATP